MDCRYRSARLAEIIFLYWEDEKNKPLWRRLKEFMIRLQWCFLGLFSSNSGRANTRTDWIPGLKISWIVWTFSFLLIWNLDAQMHRKSVLFFFLHSYWSCPSLCIKKRENAIWVMQLWHYSNRISEKISDVIKEIQRFGKNSNTSLFRRWSVGMFL